MAMLAKLEIIDTSDLGVPDLLISVAQNVLQTRRDIGQHIIMYLIGNVPMRRAVNIHLLPCLMQFLPVFHWAVYQFCVERITDNKNAIAIVAHFLSKDPSWITPELSQMVMDLVLHATVNPLPVFEVIMTSMPAKLNQVQVELLKTLSQGDGLCNFFKKVMTERGAGVFEDDVRPLFMAIEDKTPAYRTFVLSYIRARNIDTKKIVAGRIVEFPIDDWDFLQLVFSDSFNSLPAPIGDAALYAYLIYLIERIQDGDCSLKILFEFVSSYEQGKDLAAAGIYRHKLGVRPVTDSPFYTSFCVAGSPIAGIVHF
jgi:hypothetical protein